MSNLIYACWRRKEDSLDVTLLERVAEWISLVNLPDHPHEVRTGFMDCCCLTGPVGAARMKGSSAHVGAFAGSSQNWHKPGHAIPEGSFALVRTNDRTVELCSDYSGSRTLWYVLTDRHFFASTSQRALLCLLGGFKVNKAAVSWFLSSGSLGPKDSWDSRIQRLPANARLSLDRSSWAHHLRCAPVEFRPRAMTPEACEKELAALLRETIQSFEFPPAHWILPLSGGADSRCILAAMHEGGLRPRTITWGMASSITQPGNDAFVARRLAEHYGLAHDYLLTENPEASPTQVVDRFLSACGGTTDQLQGYLDGLQLWSSLPRQGVDGIIRGDAGFTSKPVRSVQQARTSTTMVMLSDFMDEGLAEQLSDGRQSVPEELRHTGHESIISYRNRIYQAFRIPVGLAALSDVKAPFVEIASPLLSRRVLEFIRQMPDSCRADRSIYIRVVRGMVPSIPFATMEADDNNGDFLWSVPYSGWIKEELASETAHHLFPEPFLHNLAAEIQKGRSALAPSRSFRAAVKRVIPPRWIRRARAWLGGPDEVPERGQMAFRVSLICRTIRMLEKDAATHGPIHE